MTTIPTPAGNIILVEVQPDWYKFKLVGIQTSEGKAWYIDYRDSIPIPVSLQLGIIQSELEYLGIIENGTPDFDVEGLVETSEHKAWLYKDYMSKKSIGIATKTDSFRSLLLSQSVDLNKKFVVLKKK